MLKAGEKTNAKEAKELMIRAQNKFENVRSRIVRKLIARRCKLLMCNKINKENQMLEDFFGQSQKSSLISVN